MQLGSRESALNETILWILGGFAAVCAAIAAYLYRKVDTLEVRVNKAHENFVTRADLLALEGRIEARAGLAENRGTAQHADNTDNFREIRLQLESVGSKLFDLANKRSSL